MQLGGPAGAYRLKQSGVVAAAGAHILHVRHHLPGYADGWPKIALEDDPSDILRKASRGVGLDAAELARRTGLDGGAIAAWIKGDGIPAEDHARVMEPLYSTKARGLGLGLAIARSIVEKNQGSLRVASEPGRGSTFTIRLTASTSPCDGAAS